MKKVLLAISYILIFFILGYIIIAITAQQNQDFKKKVNSLNFDISLLSTKTVSIKTVKIQNYNIRFRDTIPDLDTTKQNILLIGDSMAYSIMFRLHNYCRENNHNLHTVTWVSGSTKWYANTDTLTYYINKYDPSLILFVIGANELFVTDAPSRIKYVEKILKKMKGVKNLWIGPPNWAKDTGINDMMMNSLGYRKFFLSAKLNYERKKGDVAHPSRKSSAIWMDSIAKWIVNTSYYPFRLEKPDKPDEKKVDYTVLKPMG